MLRRVLLPVVVGIELVLLAAFLGLGVVGLVAGLADRRRRLARLAAMAAAYLVLELIGLTALGGLFVARIWQPRDRWLETNRRLLAWLLSRVLSAGERTVSFRVELDGPESCRPLQDRDPVLVLARHGGIGDSFVMVWLLADRFARKPRVVVKDTLLWDPLIDVALSRLGAAFIPAYRRGGASAGRIGRLAMSLEPGDSLLLFPEGANWTPKRRWTAIRRLWESKQPSAARAASLMEHVLPPRAAGVAACLDADPDRPVVVVAHAGLDRITTAGGLWAAIPFRQSMLVRWWEPVPPPAGEEGRMRWITTEWAVVDQWVDAVRANATDRGTSGTTTVPPSRRDHPPTSS